MLFLKTAIFTAIFFLTSQSTFVAAEPDKIDKGWAAYRAGKYDEAESIYFKLLDDPGIVSSQREALLERLSALYFKMDIDPDEIRNRIAPHCQKQDLTYCLHQMLLRYGKNEEPRSVAVQRMLGVYAEPVAKTPDDSPTLFRKADTMVIPQRYTAQNQNRPIVSSTSNHSPNSKITSKVAPEADMTAKASVFSDSLQKAIDEDRRHQQQVQKKMDKHYQEFVAKVSNIKPPSMLGRQKNKNVQMTNYGTYYGRRKDFDIYVDLTKKPGDSSWYLTGAAVNVGSGTYRFVSIDFEILDQDRAVLDTFSESSFATLGKGRVWKFDRSIPGSHKWAENQLRNANQTYSCQISNVETRLVGEPGVLQKILNNTRRKP
jgi:hypothetical protein